MAINTSLLINNYNAFLNGATDPDTKAKIKGMDEEIQGLLNQLKADPSDMVAMLQLQAKMGTLSSMTSMTSNMVKSMTDISKELARAIG
mgnify:CR=1 FL=1